MPVYQRTLEAQRFHGARQFIRGRLRRVHGERGKAAEPLWTTRDLLRKKIIVLDGAAYGGLRIEFALHARTGLGQDDEVNPGLVHFGKPYVVEVAKARREIG